MKDCGTCLYFVDAYTHWICNNANSEHYHKHRLEDDLACDYWDDWN